MGDTQDRLGPMRLPFIILTPACVFLGLASGTRDAESVRIFNVVLMLLAAVSAHISVNAFNEYFDYKSGLDYRTKRTPFSGGSGTLPKRPELANWTLASAVVTFLIVSGLGLYFIIISSLGLLPLGILGLFLIYAYTPWLSHHALLCLIAPGLGFGPVMVMGSSFVLTGAYSWPAFISALVPFFLVSNLLLLNQFPDVDADKSIDRSNYPIVIGRRSSIIIYIGFLALTYLSILAGVGLQQLPVFSLLGLATLLLAIPVGVGSLKYADDPEKLVPYMAGNVVINLATPVLVGIGLLI